MPTTLTVTALAQRLEVTRHTVYNMWRSGRIPAPIPLTKPPRWDGETIDAWLKGRETPQPADA